MRRRTGKIISENSNSIEGSVISQSIILIFGLNAGDKLVISFVTFPIAIDAVSGLDFWELSAKGIFALVLESLDGTVVGKDALVVNKSDAQGHHIAVQRTQTGLPVLVVRGVQLPLLLRVPVPAVAEDRLQTVHSQVPPRVLFRKHESAQVVRVGRVLTGFPVTPDTVFDKKSITCGFWLFTSRF